MTARNVFYFAFGSNIDQERLRARVPDAALIGAASRPGCMLAFHGRPTPWLRRPGVANLATKTGAVVWGALYRMSGASLEALDRFEGTPTVYQRRQGVVYLHDTQAGVARAPIAQRAWYYIMDNHQGPSAPEADYVAYIRRGYAHLGLPVLGLEDALRPFARPPVAYERWRGYAPR